MPLVKFVTPPPARSRKAGKHEQIATELKKRPNEWALVLEGVSGGHGSTINTGKHAAYQPKGAYEATSRSNGNGKVDVYVRYVGANK